MLGRFIGTFLMKTLNPTILLFIVALISMILSLTMYIGSRNHDVVCDD